MDMLIANIVANALLIALRKGVVGSFNKVEAEFEVPQSSGGVIKIAIKADNLDVKIVQNIMEEIKQIK